MPNRTVARTVPRELIRKSNLHWDRTISDDDIKELTESIERVGLINSITVRKKGKMYEYLAGERRFRALKKAGINSIPCTVVDCDDSTAELLSIEENIKAKKVNGQEWTDGVKRSAEIIKKDLILKKQETPDPKRVVRKGRPVLLESEVIDEVAKRLHTNKRSVKKALDRSKLVLPASRALANEKITQRQADLLSHMKKDEQYNNLPKMINETEKESASRVSSGKVNEEEEGSPAKNKAYAKAFDKILARCRDLNALMTDFLNEATITDAIISTIIHTDRDYLIHCHKSMTSMLENIERVESGKKRSHRE
jgi:ParB/RepB/Spo0J family partition protein